ncbi:MAG: GNAT family N-acetyltransferase [Chloroflexi bacterium]|nr:GNAT family N-acetyltransferase [Chloroflexota bacterium]
MLEGLALRPYVETDAEAVRRACFPQVAPERVHEMLARVAAGKRSVGVVATLDAQVVGFGQLTLWRRVAEISDLSVTQAQRGRGIGTALLKHLIALGAAQRPVIEIGVAQRNVRALALYQRLGFRHDRTLLLDLGQGVEPVLYLTLSVRSVSDSAEAVR